MASRRYVGLLRGINVGAANQIPMADLREAFETAGHAAVQTYIRSGNVVFETDAPRASLEGDIEAMLERRYGAAIAVVVRDARQLRHVVDGAPGVFAEVPATHHCDVAFLKKPLTAQRAVAAFSLREGVDRIWPGKDVVYFARLSARRTQSRMSKVVGTPEYRLMTIRNWNTTRKLLALLDD